MTCGCGANKELTGAYEYESVHIIKYLIKMGELGWLVAGTNFGD